MTAVNIMPMQGYSTVNRPYARPESGQNAVKVIYHYGDMVLEVFVI